VWGSEFTTKAATLKGCLIVVLKQLFAAALVVRSQVNDRCTRAIARGAARCASQVLDRGAQVDARDAMHVLDRGVQAVARCAARCALHVHGRCARTDACGLSFTVLSTQVSTVGLRLG